MIASAWLFVRASNDFFRSEIVKEDDLDAGFPRGNDVALDDEEMLLLSFAKATLVLDVFVDAIS